MANLKATLSRLKQSQELEKMAANEDAPETAQAAKTMLERLRGPSQQSSANEMVERLRAPREQQTDISPLFALASPGVREGLIATKSNVEGDEDRLMKAAKMEQLVAKLRGSGSNRAAAQEERERKEIRTQLAPALAGTKRSKLVRDHVKALDSIELMENQIDLALSGNSPVTEADTFNISSLWSGVLTGGVPSQTLIEKSVYNSAGKSIRELKAYATGDRKKSVYSKEDLTHIKNQLNILKAAKRQAYGRTLEKALRPYETVLKKYPEQMQTIAETYGDLIDMDEQGKFKAKSFDPMTGSEGNLKRISAIDNQKTSQGIKVRNLQTGKTGVIPADKAEAALASGQFERIQ